MPATREKTIHASLARLTWLELLALNVRLGRARRRVLRAALRAGSLQQVRDMIRIHHDLTGLAHDVDGELDRSLAPWLSP